MKIHEDTHQSTLCQGPNVQVIEAEVEAEATRDWTQFDCFFFWILWKNEKFELFLCWIDELINLDFHWIPATNWWGLAGSRPLHPISSIVLPFAMVRQAHVKSKMVADDTHTQIFTHLQIHDSWSDISVAMYNSKLNKKIFNWRYSCPDLPAFGHGFPGSIILLSNGSAIRTKCLVCFGYEGTENEDSAWSLDFAGVMLLLIYFDLSSSAQGLPSCTSFPIRVLMLSGNCDTSRLHLHYFEIQYDTLYSSNFLLNLPLVLPMEGCRLPHSKTIYFCFQIAMRLTKAVFHFPWLGLLWTQPVLNRDSQDVFLLQSSWHVESEMHWNAVISCHFMLYILYLWCFQF